VAREALPGSNASLVKSASEEQATGSASEQGAKAFGATIAVLRSESKEEAESIAAQAANGATFAILPSEDEAKATESQAASSEFEENATASKEELTVNDHLITVLMSESSDSDQESDALYETCAETKVSNPRHTRISMVM
jgi:hypothetical protein